MNEKNELINKLHKLKQEHRDLDEILIQLQEKKTVNLLQIHAYELPPHVHADVHESSHLNYHYAGANDGHHHGCVCVSEQEFCACVIE